MANKSETEIQSWKEIGAYLQRDARTAQRWEKEEGLPVHRHGHSARSSVYAYPSELDAWRRSRKLAPEPIPPPALWKRLWRPSFAAALVLCLFLAGSGIRPVSARQSDGKMAARQVWVPKSYETPLDISPDGRYFAVTDWSTGDLAVHDLKTGVSRRLTIQTVMSEAEDATFSPDGKQVAYSWYEDKEPPFALMTVPVGGGSPRTVWKGSGKDDSAIPVAWTPDGKQLLVRYDHVKDSCDLTFLTVQGGSIRSIKTFDGRGFRTAALSPDGKWIAYDEPNPGGGTSVSVLSADGARQAKVSGAGNHPVWSPDGSRIVFLSGRTGRRTLWSVPVADGKPGKEELIKDDIGGVLWMTRAGTLFYQNPAPGGPNIYSAELNLDGKISQPPVLAVHSFVNGNSAPSLSPDGESLLFRSAARGAMLRSLATGEERILTLEKRDCCGGAQWFPDGRSVLVTSQNPPWPGPNFYRTDLQTGKAELLFHAPSRVQGFVLSPDGKAVFYSEPDRLVRHDLETKRETELRKVEEGTDSFYSVALSPDGKQLAYVYWDGKSPNNVQVMPSEGGPSRQVSAAGADVQRYNALAWTRQYLLYVSKAGENGQTQLWRVPAAGGAAEQTGITMPSLNSVQADPGGRKIYFSADDSGPQEIWTLDNFLPKSPR